MAKNFFPKKPKSSAGNDWKSSGSFIRKPQKGWLHADRLLESAGVTYDSKYVGAVKITDSLRNIPFNQRGDIVREAITICCAKTNRYNFKPKKVSLTHGIIGDVQLKLSGHRTMLTVSKSHIKAFAMESGEMIAHHRMESISFASMGEDECKQMIGYVSKDPTLDRACFIFECCGGTSDDVILTVGQAFELKYKEYLNKSTVIQPTVGKFTDPGSVVSSNDYEFDTTPTTAHSYTNHEMEDVMEEDIPSADYDHLQRSKNQKPKNSESDYNTLEHNRNSHVLSSNSSDIGAEFATGPSYFGSDSGIATVYDNPIAKAVQPKQQPKPMISTEPSTTTAVIYDNPKNVIQNPVRNKDQIYLAPKITRPAETRNRANNNNTQQQYPDICMDLCKQAWFHGALSRNEAEKLIHQDGEFLVRESGNNSSGQFVLTGMRNGTPRHLLLVDPNGQVRTRDHSFESVSALIKYHMTHNIPISSGTSEVYLIHDVHNLRRDAAESFLI